jgi:hypothetical protein
MNLIRGSDKFSRKNEGFMASALQGFRPSIFPLSSELPTEVVGNKNPIALPLVKIADIGRTIGKKIGQGSCVGVYMVNNSRPQRVYKVISLDRFANGDEIRIAKIASDARVSPAFYGACLVQQGTDKFVFMEMDHAGKSLFRWMEDLALEADVGKASLIEDSSSQMAKERALKELAEMKDDGSAFKVVAVEETPSISMEEAVDKLYKSREDFFFDLFSAIKKLAENNIAYKDTNCGNLIPNVGDGFKLIDFDSAEFVGSSEEAAVKSVQSMYNQQHFTDFCALKDLSLKSRELIRWFQTQHVEQTIRLLSQAV